MDIIHEGSASKSTEPKSNVFSNGGKEKFPAEKAASFPVAFVRPLPLAAAEKGGRGVSLKKEEGVATGDMEIS